MGDGGGRVSGFEVIYTFAEGGGASIARLDADTFEEAAAHAVMQVPGRSVKRIELTDLSYEDAEAARE